VLSILKNKQVIQGKRRKIFEIIHKYIDKIFTEV